MKKLMLILLLFIVPLTFDSCVTNRPHRNPYYRTIPFVEGTKHKPIKRMTKRQVRNAKNSKYLYMHNKRSDVIKRRWRTTNKYTGTR